MPRRPSTLHHAGRAFAALAVGAAVALAAGSSGAGADRAATRAVLAGAGSGHLPAYAGAQRPALTGASPPAAQPTFTATTGPATPPPTEPGPPTEPPPVPTAALGVLAREYTTTLSRSRIAPGEVTVQLQNVGEDPHDLRIVRTDATGDPVQFPETAPGATTTRQVRFTPGTYRLLCTLNAPSSHDAAGMNATLTVAAG